MFDKNKIVKLFSHEGFAERRFSSGEFLSLLAALIAPVAAVGSLWPLLDPEMVSKGLSVLSSAYVLSRTLTKNNRQRLRSSSIRSSEFWVHLLIGQLPAAAMLNRGKLSPELALFLIVANASVFILCRGLVKARAFIKSHQRV